MRRLGVILCSAALAGGSCQAGPSPWIEPFDGQSAVPLDAVLVAHLAAADLPPDWPAPDPIRVVDLDDGGVVDGKVSRDGDDLRFTPTDGWQPERRYAWTVDLPEGTPHGPEIANAAQAEGTAAFTTSESALDLVGAALDGESLCLLFSRPPASVDLEGLAVWVNDVDVVLFDLAPADFASLVDDGAEADTVGAACGTPSQPVSAGAEARVRAPSGITSRWAIDAGADVSLARLRRRL